MSVIKNIIIMLLGFLPSSPFQSFIEKMEQIEELKYINYFIPIDAFIAIGTAWLSCMGLYIAYVFITNVLGKGK
ncbi:MAG: hypothetical protein RR238_05235 [Lachnospiraceae bacterium]